MGLRDLSDEELLEFIKDPQLYTSDEDRFRRVFDFTPELEERVDRLRKLLPDRKEQPD